MLIFREKVFWISFLLVSAVLGFLFNYLYSNDLAVEMIASPKVNGVVKDDKELKKQIGQMIMIGFRGTEASADSYFERSEKQGSEEQSSEGSYITKVIQDLKIGGVVLFDYDVPSKSFPRNIINPEQTKSLISDLQKYSSIPLFIAVDAEGGKVNRLKPEYGFIAVSSPKEMGRGSIENTEKIANDLAKELKNLGFNMNLAPVVDVNINPKNPIIGGLDRSFSADPAQVFEHAKAFILAHRQNNIITVAKHFPGHGSSSSDSHLGIVDITESYKEEELIPYERLQNEGLLDSVMIAHIINRNVDANSPATLSPIFIKGILRNQIGFKGLVISDDAQMGAISENYSFEEAVIKMVNAGCNIIAISNNSPLGYDENLPYKTFDIIYNAVKRGEISAEKITESYELIYKLKKQYLFDRGQ